MGCGDSAADRGPQGNRVGNGSPSKEGKVRADREAEGRRATEDQILLARAVKTQLPGQPHQIQELQIGRNRQELTQGHVDLLINQMGGEVLREEACEGVKAREKTAGLTAGDAAEAVGDLQREDQGAGPEV